MTERWSRAGDVAWVDEDGRVVVLRLGALAERPLVLDGTAAAVWRHLDPPVALEPLVARLAETYDAPVDVVGPDVTGFLDQAVQSGIVLREGRS